MARKRPTSARIQKRYNRHGFLAKVENKSGTKVKLFIAEDKDGYSAYGSDFKTIEKTKKNPEKLALNLAKKGHKEVVFLD